MYLKELDIQTLTDIKSKFAFWKVLAFKNVHLMKFKANPLMYPYKWDIQMLINTKPSSSFRKFSLLEKFTLK